MVFKRKTRKLEGKISKEFEIVIQGVYVGKVVVKRWEVFHQIIPPEQKKLEVLRENRIFIDHSHNL